MPQLLPLWGDGSLWGDGDLWSRLSGSTLYVTEVDRTLRQISVKVNYSSTVSFKVHSIVPEASVKQHQPMG